MAHGLAGRKNGNKKATTFDKESQPFLWLKKDGQLESGFYGPDTGTWSYDKAKKTLTTNTSGITQVFQVEVLTENKLQLRSAGNPEDDDYLAFAFEAE